MCFVLFFIVIASGTCSCAKLPMLEIHVLFQTNQRIASNFFCWNQQVERQAIDRVRNFFSTRSVERQKAVAQRKKFFYKKLSSVKCGCWILCFFFFLLSSFSFLDHYFRLSQPIHACFTNYYGYNYYNSLDNKLKFPELQGYVG